MVRGIVSPMMADASIAEQEEAPLVWSARWSLTTRILAVNILAIALLVTLRLTVRSALLLLTLFMVQLLASVLGSDRVHEVTILAMSGVYLALAVVLLALRRRAVAEVGHTAFVRDLDTVGTEPVEPRQQA